ncbi:hypothetical protein GGS20DRAFT_527782 [Poronia punctata]|nr:hypothetical protein GGS20DRAFT_527782 [Poronia punctata]
MRSQLSTDNYYVSRLKGGTLRVHGVKLEPVSTRRSGCRGVFQVNQFQRREGVEVPGLSGVWVGVGEDLNRQLIDVHGKAWCVFYLGGCYPINHRPFIIHTKIGVFFSFYSFFFSHSLAFFITFIYNRYDDFAHLLIPSFCCLLYGKRKIVF